MNRAWPVVVPALLLLPACSQTGALPGPAPPARPSAAPSGDPGTVDPFRPGPACTVRVGARELALTETQAVSATALAAGSLARADPVGHLGRRVARELPGLSLTEREGRRLARALLGYDGPSLTCAHGQAVLREQRLTPSGLTRRAARLRTQLTAAFGTLPMGGFAAGGVTSGHLDGSSHYEGRAIDVFFRPHTDRAQARRGWVVSQWLVAHAGRLRILSVIYRDRIWTVWASFAGWRSYVHPSGNRTNPVLRHLDHVHTAVLGGPYRGDRG